jgi:predicted nucleic acid-binding protein
LNQAARQLGPAGVIAPPFVKTVSLTERDVTAALGEVQSRGVRGGAVYDCLHLVAARKASVEALVTLDLPQSRALVRPGDPRIDAV